MRRSFAFAALAFLVLGACDRHPAGEVRESYGHGSSHKKDFRAHSIDSKPGSSHFSDSQGVEPHSAEEHK